MGDLTGDIIAMVIFVALAVVLVSLEVEADPMRLIGAIP